MPPKFVWFYYALRLLKMLLFFRNTGRMLESPLINSNRVRGVIMKAAKLLRNYAAPTPDMLFERAMKDEQKYPELAIGSEIVPIFNPNVRVAAEGDRETLYDNSGDAYGVKQLYVAESDFGIDYMNALYSPLDGPRHDFYIDIDTPVATGIHGLNDEVAARLLREVGVPVLLKGPEFSGGKQTGLRGLGRVALASSNVSQSFSAETSMAITEKILALNPHVPSTAAVYGKSRGAMIGGKKYPYAHDAGINVVHYRLIDPCVGKRALEGVGDIMRYGAWPASDLLRSVPSFARFALEGNLRARARTVETSSAYLAGMVLGTVPSLLSGEAMGNRIPVHKGVSLVHMASNPIADTAEYLEQFKQHLHFDHHEIPDTHIGGIVLPRNIARSVRHFKEFGAEFDRAAGDEHLINWDKVHNNPNKLDTTQTYAA